MKQAAYFIPDLFFAPRIADALKHLDFDAREIRLPEEISGADLIVVQLEGPRSQWLALIQAAKQEGVPVLAFGRHTDAETLRIARQTGAQKVVPNSQLVSELPDLIASLTDKTHG